MPVSSFNRIILHRKIFRSFFSAEKACKTFPKIEFSLIFLANFKIFWENEYFSRGSSSSISSNKFTSNFVEGDSNSIGDSVLSWSNRRCQKTLKFVGKYVSFLSVIVVGSSLARFLFITNIPSHVVVVVFK